MSSRKMGGQAVLASKQARGRRASLEHQREYDANFRDETTWNDSYTDWHGKPVEMGDLAAMPDLDDARFSQSPVADLLRNHSEQFTRDNGLPVGVRQQGTLSVYRRDPSGDSSKDTLERESPSGDRIFSPDYVVRNQNPQAWEGLLNKPHETQTQVIGEMGRQGVMKNPTLALEQANALDAKAVAKANSPMSKLRGAIGGAVEGLKKHAVKQGVSDSPVSQQQFASSMPVAQPNLNNPSAKKFSTGDRGRQ